MPSEGGESAADPRKDGHPRTVRSYLRDAEEPVVEQGMLGGRGLQLAATSPATVLLEGQQKVEPREAGKGFLLATTAGLHRHLCVALASRCALDTFAPCQVVFFAHTPIPSSSLACIGYLSVSLSLSLSLSTPPFLNLSFPFLYSLSSLPLSLSLSLSLSLPPAIYLSPSM
jgi:hypothetical protein